MCMGVIGTLLETWDDDGVPMGRVVTAEVEETACLLYVPEAEPGRPVVIHLGFVTEVLDPSQAADARALRKEARS